MTPQPVPQPEPALAPLGGASHRRHLAILFCDLCGSTRIAASMEPELYADLLQQLREMLLATVARHGGEVVRIDGDGAVCIFGYPDPHEDCGRRATETAIDLHAAAATLDVAFGTPIRLHSGIHAGVVLLREGDLVRGRFEMLGDATNIAARLCDHAGSDEIMVSEATLGADRHFFRAGLRQQVRVAGHARPLAHYSIYGREKVATRYAARVRQGVTPFAGRGPELARLRGWLAEAGAGPILVAGPPGIGKTRLLAEFLGEAAAQGVAVHRGYCEAYLAAPPLQPLVQLARSIGGEAAPDPAAGLEPLVEAMRALLAAAGPCILAIDDWQWADGASRDALEALLPGVPDARLLLVSRETDARLAAARIETVELPPLAPDEAQAAIAALLPTPDAFLARRIVDESGGSPLFLEELCHASARGGGELEATERNAWLDMMIQARFAQLPPDRAMLVRAAAVIGPIVPAALFAALTGVAEDDPELAALAEADFLFPGEVDGTLRFKHGITRDAIYRAIGLRERKALHRRVIEAIIAESGRSGDAPSLDALAHHYAAAGDTANAVPHAIRAGDAALAAGALDRAQAHYRQAFALAAAEGNDGPLAERIWPLVNKYGLACIVDPAPDQLPVMREMAERLREIGHDRALVRSEYWLGAIAYGLGEARQSVMHETAALRAAEALGQVRLVPQIQAKLAQSLFAAGRYDEADALFGRIFAARPEGSGALDDDSLVYALCCHGFLHADRGDFAAAEARYAQADAVRGSAAPPMLASYLTQKSAMALMRGEWEQALAHAGACLEACGRTRARYQAMMSHALGAYARWQLERDPAAVQTLLGAARWFAAGNSRQRTSLLHGWLADIMAETGRADLARRHAAEAVARARRTGDRLGEAMAYRAVARTAPRLRAGRYLAAADRSADLRGSPRERAQTRLCEGELAIAAGEPARAAPLLAAARDAFEGMAMPRFAERAEALLSATR